MIYLIAYDIGNNRVRNRLAKYLGREGRRLQKSIFLCDLTAKEIKRVKDKIHQITEDEARDVVLVPLCHGCQRKVQTLGRDNSTFTIL